MALTALEIKHAKPGMHADGNGLYLRVQESGGKSWIFRYQLNGKRREMGLGTLDTIAATDARARAGELRKLVKAKKDPIEERDKAIEAARAAAEAEAEAARAAADARAAALTFREVAADYINAARAGWKSAKHAQQWQNTLATYAFPTIGAKPVSEVTTTDMLTILRPIWNAKAETASRVRNRIEIILDAAKALGLRDGENPARLRGHLDKLLKGVKKSKRVNHHAALPWADAPRFMEKLRERTGTATLALEFAILCASRYGEVARATWREFDIDAAVWRIPSTRMKAGKEHIVPLSPRAMEIITALPRGGAGDLLFPSRNKTPLSDSALTAVIDRIHEADVEAGGKGFTDPSSGRVVTQHGFRSTFRDWVLEATFHAEVLAEIALAHLAKDKVEAAYLRGNALEKRRALMIEWADHLAGTATGSNVVQLHKKTA